MLPPQNETLLRVEVKSPQALTKRVSEAAGGPQACQQSVTIDALPPSLAGVSFKTPLVRAS